MDQFAYAAHIVGSMSKGTAFGPESNLVITVTLFRTTETEKFQAVADTPACVTKVRPRGSGLVKDTTSVLEAFTGTTWSGSEMMDATSMGLIVRSNGRATT